MDVDEAKQKLIDYLNLYHRKVSIDDLIITDTPGYFRLKKKCGGRGICNNPIHTFLFNEGGIFHTISFFDNARDKTNGRFISPYRTWETLKESGALN